MSEHSQHDMIIEPLYGALCQISTAISKLEKYEFIYALDNLIPPQGWDSVVIIPPDNLFSLIRQRSFFEGIQLESKIGGKTTIDPTVLNLTRMLLVGLSSNQYNVSWVKQYFYFDIRSFLFFIRTEYFTPTAVNHFNNKPTCQLDRKQVEFDAVFDIGYKEFSAANREVDDIFIKSIIRLINSNGTPTIFTIAGPTGAGKTEIVFRICQVLENLGLKHTSIEMDHFMKDRSFRDSGYSYQEAMHFDLFRQAMDQILSGVRANIPQYDFYRGVSSHDPSSLIRPGAQIGTVEPADVILLEGNFPFHIPEVADYVGTKIVYLTDDPIRLKRKWKRDIDYRKKYDVSSFCNRFFRTQRLRAEDIYQPLISVSEMVVNTTFAELWAVPALEGFVKDF